MQSLSGGVCLPSWKLPKSCIIGVLWRLHDISMINYYLLFLLKGMGGRAENSKLLFIWLDLSTHQSSSRSPPRVVL